MRPLLWCHFQAAVSAARVLIFICVRAKGNFPSVEKENERFRLQFAKQVRNIPFDEKRGKAQGEIGHRSASNNEPRPVEWQGNHFMLQV
jgi:hypothetical protein